VRQQQQQRTEKRLMTKKNSMKISRLGGRDVLFFVVVVVVVLLSITSTLPLCNATSEEAPGDGDLNALSMEIPESTTVTVNPISCLDCGCCGWSCR